MPLLSARRGTIGRLTATTSATTASAALTITAAEASARAVPATTPEPALTVAAAPAESTLAITAAPAHAGGTLIGWASMPANTPAEGPTTGQFAIGGFGAGDHPLFEVLRYAMRPYMFTASSSPVTARGKRDLCRRLWR